MRNVLVADFRSGSLRATAIAGEPELVAMTFNGTSEIAMVIRDDGDSNGATANHDAAKTLSRIHQQPVVYVDVPENIARLSMRQLGVPASLIEGLLGRFLF